MRNKVIQLCPLRAGRAFRRGTHLAARPLPQPRVRSGLGAFAVAAYGAGQADDLLAALSPGVLGESATNSGAVITPLSVSVVVGAMLASFVVSMLKRYQVVTIVGAIVMTVGVLLPTQMTISTSLLEAVIFMVIAGIGMGTFFAVVTLVAQNALPRTRLGVGTAAVRYLGQLGAVLGVAIVGTVVNQTLSSEIVKRLFAWG
jgi:MFS family permease